MFMRIFLFLLFGFGVYFLNIIGNSANNLMGYGREKVECKGGSMPGPLHAHIQLHMFSTPLLRVAFTFGAVKSDREAKKKRKQTVGGLWSCPHLSLLVR